jgi:nicotinamidase-related amidase
MNQATIELPVRFTGGRENQQTFATLSLAVAQTAFLLVDCDGDCGEACNGVIERTIAPTLQVIRQVGMKVVYLVGDPMPDGRSSIAAELHYGRRGRPLPTVPWRPRQPIWSDSITPLPHEPVIAKSAQGGFGGSYLDRYLRAHGIETLLVVGFSFKACVWYTIVGAFEYNYRAIFLRDGTDPPGANEFPDTIDLSLPEGGWVRTILTRLIEDHLGYSSTCTELIQACYDV